MHLPAPPLVLATDPRDAADIVALRDSLARWQLDRGITQWLPGELAVAPIEAQVRAGEWFVLRCDDDLVATARLLADDPHTWGPERGRDGTAGYLHGLMVARSHAGSGLGAAILEWFCDFCELLGRRWARLDCVASNTALRRYYAEHGFTEVGETDFGPHSGWSAVTRFQRAVDR